MTKNLYIAIIVIILLITTFYYFSKISNTEAVYVKSDLNDREYLVQNLENKEEATYILSIINERILLFRDYLSGNINNYPEFSPYIKQFCERVKKIELYENAPDGRYTSYTVNKGEEMALCLRSKKTGDLHDINLIMYVVIHELAHIACPEVDHTELFKRIFVFFLEVAISIKIYKKVDYQIDPHEYCGLLIKENLLK